MSRRGYAIPQDWIAEPLGYVMANIIDFRGKTPLKIGMNWGGGNIPALSANNVEMGQINFKKECYFGSDALYSKWMNNGDCAKNDVVMTMEAPLGNVALIPDDKKYILSQRVILMKPDSKKLSGEYLFHCLQSDSFQRMMDEESTGTTAKGIQRRKLEKLSITRPQSIEEQQKIVQILDSIDEQIDATERLIEKKKDIKDGLLIDFFASPLVQNSPLLKIKDLAEGGLFIDGDWVELPHISESGIRFVQTGNIGIGKFINKNKNFIFESSFEKLNCTEVQEGDVLICRLAEPAGRACLAPKSDERMITSVDVAILRIVNPEISPQYINYALNIQQQLNKVEILAAGSTRKRISRKNLGMMELNIPSINSQNKILLTLSSIDSEITYEEAALEKLKQQKLGLMQDLLTGRVRVN